MAGQDYRKSARKTRGPDESLEIAATADGRRWSSIGNITQRLKGRLRGSHFLSGPSSLFRVLAAAHVRRRERRERRGRACAPIGKEPFGPARIEVRRGV